MVPFYTPPPYKITQTYSGRALLFTLLVVTGGYLLAFTTFRPLAGALDASLGVLMAGFPAWLTGICARVYRDMLSGRRFYLFRRDPFVQFGYLVVAVVLTVVQVTVALHIQVDSTGWAAALAPLAQLGALGLVYLAGWAGFADGDDATIRDTLELERQRAVWPLEKGGWG